TRQALDDIKRDSAKASASYYHPFFANYALGLEQALRRIVQALRKKGKGIAFVRDTPRKDVLFPTGEAMIETLRSSGCAVRASSAVVRHHIGMRRRKGHRSLQGLAQREWTISFERLR